MFFIFFENLRKKDLSNDPYRNEKDFKYYEFLRENVSAGYESVLKSHGIETRIFMQQALVISKIRQPTTVFESSRVVDFTWCNVRT